MSSAFPAAAATPSLATKRVEVLAARLTRTLGIACALAEAGRQVDLAGIEDGVGMLCAQALDAYGPEGEGLVPVLQEVLHRVDRLTALITASRAGV